MRTFHPTHRQIVTFWYCQRKEHSQKILYRKKEKFLLKIWQNKNPGVTLEVTMVFTINILFFKGSRYSENAFVEIKKVSFMAVVKP